MNQFPAVPSYQVWLAAFRNSLAELLARAGKPRTDTALSSDATPPATQSVRGKLPEARSLLEDTITTLTGLLDKNPDMGFIHGMLAKGYRDLASMPRQSGEQEQASKAERKAEEHQAKVRNGPAGGP